MGFMANRRLMRKRGNRGSAHPRRADCWDTRCAGAWTRSKPRSSPHPVSISDVGPENATARSGPVRCRISGSIWRPQSHRIAGPAEGDRADVPSFCDTASARITAAFGVEALHGFSGRDAVIGRNEGQGIDDDKRARPLARYGAVWERASRAACPALFWPKTES
jgi:hypothetical protein